MLQAVLIGLVAGVLGTGIGGLVVIILRRPKDALLSIMLGFAAGIMLAIISFELIPESINQGGKSVMLCGFLIGIIIMLIGDLFIGHLHMAERDKGSDLHQQKLSKTGWLLTVGIAMHNFPEGLAIGVGFATDKVFGMTIALMIALQNAPEGVALAAPTYASGKSRTATIILACLAGLPMAAGALVGFLVGGLSPEVLSGGLGFAAGAMFFITCDELIPSAHVETEKFGHLPILSIVAGYTLGLLLSFIS